jgi:hypothetical protein
MMFSKKMTWAGIGLSFAAALAAPAIAATAKRASHAAPASADTTSPVLRAFQAGTSVDLGVSTSQLSVDLSISDDLSGLDSFSFYVRKPSGASEQMGMFGAGAINFRERVPLPLSPFAEPGTWEITGITGQDRAGNHFYVDGLALATMGNVRFTVINKATDAKPPKLISGKVLTPTVSRSAPAPGTSLPYNEARAQATVLDAGNRVISGIASSALVYCLADGSNCIYLGNFPRGAYGEAKRTIQVSSSVWPSDAIGTYHLARVILTDNAGNERIYVDTAFGGDTDFSALFSSLTIDVTP